MLWLWQQLLGKVKGKHVGCIFWDPSNLRFFARLFRDADYIFSALLDYERVCLLSATNANEIAKAQAAFLATVVSKFTTEAFHTLRRYLQSTGDTKNLLSLLLKAQRFTDAGIAVVTKALQTEDFREKQGMLSVGTSNT